MSYEQALGRIAALRPDLRASTTGLYLSPFKIPACALMMRGR